jgi:glycosyltransferase involved in cell wall biosynthesis
VNEIVLIATVLNEKSNIVSWLNSLVNQSVKANQIVIVDGGSTDGTQELILDFARESPIEIKFISFLGASHAKGRNIALDAIEKSFEIAIFVDAGCYYRVDYVARFCAALDNQQEATIVGMAWIAQRSSGNLDTKITPDWGRFSLEQWATFLPSARAFALNRAALNLNLRFPEWLTRTGEDTAFMIEAKQFVENWLLVTAPEVEWHSPEDDKKLAELEFKYAIGDGESGVRDLAFFDLTSINDSKFRHFMDGYEVGFKNRPHCDLRRGCDEVWIVCSLTPFADSGGAQRTSQIARELIKQKKRVVFLSAEPSYEDPINKVKLDLDPTLLTLSFPESELLIEQLRIYNGLNFSIFCLVEAPHQSFREFLDRLTFENVSTIYTEIDEWQGLLGSSWFLDEERKKIIEKVDCIAVSAKNLKEGLEKYTGRPISYIPNAASIDRFNSFQHKHHEPPSRLITYAGALWGDWFDWGQLIDALDTLEDCNFSIIGDLDLWRRDLLEIRYTNAVLPGLVDQTELPEIYCQSSVLLIPFLLNNITVNVNPLKIHEYILMNRPVVSSRLPELQLLGDCDHIFYYDPSIPSDMSRAIRSALQWNGKCSEQLMEDGPQHTGIFTWGGIVDLYRQKFASFE